VKIVLVGYRGTGKTSVGRALAHRFNLPFRDTDALIEQRAGMPIPEIFARFGEEHFRELEREVIASLRDADGVISTGGGAVCDPANVEHLRWRGATVLLTADPRIIEGRIAGSDRPGLTHLSPGDEIQELLRRRKRAYLGAADVCIDTGSRSVEDIADEICRYLTDGPVPLEQRREAGRHPAALDRAQLARVVERDPLTRICGIAGNPCAHSRSPTLYNRLFAHFGMNYHYTRLQWHDVGEIIRFARSMQIRGLSVTIPFKVDVMRHLDEVDAHAAAIGAVNTVVHCGGRMYGHNTDWLGVMNPLGHRRGARAAVFGAGGAASAAVYALLHLDMDVTILNRTPDKARRLAERFGCEWAPLGAFVGSDADVVVNATPVGMEPDTRSLLAADQLAAGTTVFDLVYTPPETPLIMEAKRAGCETIPGTEMFVHQAVEQFRLITGIAAPPSLVREMMM